MQRATKCTGSRVRAPRQQVKVSKRDGYLVVYEFNGGGTC